MISSAFKYSLSNTVPRCFKGAVVFIYLLLNSCLAFSQDVNNLHIERVQDEGLTNEIIKCISQDKNGFMWFGTEEGLFKYDGYSFKAFRNIPGDSTTLINNVIATLYPENNNLWVGTLIGLSCIDINTHTITNFPADKPLQINTIVPGDNGTFWIATRTGFYQFNKNTHKWKRVPAIAGSTPVNFMTDDRRGHLYLSSFDGVYCFTKSPATASFNISGYPGFLKSVIRKKTLPPG